MVKLGGRTFEVCRVGPEEEEDDDDDDDDEEEEDIVNMWDCFVLNYYSCDNDTQKRIYTVYSALMKDFDKVFPDSENHSEFRTCSQ